MFGCSYWAFGAADGDEQPGRCLRALPAGCEGTLGGHRGYSVRRFAGAVACSSKDSRLGRGRWATIDTSGQSDVIGHRSPIGIWGNSVRCQRCCCGTPPAATWHRPAVSIVARLLSTRAKSVRHWSTHTL